ELTAGHPGPRNDPWINRGRGHGPIYANGIAHGGQASGLSVQRRGGDFSVLRVFGRRSGVDLDDDRQSRTQFSVGLVGWDDDPDRHTLHDLGEVAGGVLWR